jgi:hypothetical protein
MLMLQRLADGDPAEAEPFLRRGLTDLPGLEFIPAMLGWLAAETGRVEESRLALDTAATVGFARPPRNQFYVGTLVCWSAVAAHLGDADSAGAIADMLRPFPEHVVAPANFILGSLAHSRGLLATTMGDLDEAAVQFAHAEGQHARLRFPVWLASTRLEWSRVLLTRLQTGDGERARELLGQVLQVSREWRWSNVERRAVALLEDSL